MLNAIKTEDQRTTVEIGMDCIMPRIEIANDILYDAWEEFFGNVPQPSISALEAERLGRILYAAFDMTSNAIREYHLMLGHYDLDTVERFMENAEHITKTIEAKKARAAGLHTVSAARAFPLSLICPAYPSKS